MKKLFNHVKSLIGVIRDLVKLYFLGWMFLIIGILGLPEAIKQSFHKD